MEQLLDCQTIRDITNLAGNNIARNAYNCANLRFSYKFGKQRTIEFRQAEGTLDLEMQRYWITVCHGLVRSVYDHDYKDIANFCLAQADLPFEKYGLPNLLAGLGMQAQAEYFSTRLYQHGDLSSEDMPASRPLDLGDDGDDIDMDDFDSDADVDDLIGKDEEDDMSQIMDQIQKMGVSIY